MDKMIASRSSPWTRSRFLTKKSFLAVLVEEPGEFVGQLRIVPEALAEAFLDPVPVPDAHRDNAQGLLRPFPGVLEDQVDCGVGFWCGAVGVGARLPGQRGRIAGRGRC